MATRELPRRPSLEHLRNESRDLHRRRKAEDPTAKLSEAQLDVARGYGFSSWPKLRTHVETINRYFWPPSCSAPPRWRRRTPSGAKCPPSASRPRRRMAPRSNA